MREDRYKPYITTMGAFVALFVGAVGYIYQMEQRLTSTLFGLQSSIQDVRAYQKINEDRIATVDDRLTTRTQNMVFRWDQHAKEHSEISRQQHLMGNELIDVIKKIRGSQREGSAE